MEELDKNQVWNSILETLKVSVSGAIFSTWFTQTHLSRLEKLDNRYSAEIGCNSSFVKTTIENRYYGLIQDSLIKSLGSQCDLAFIVKQGIKNNGTEPGFAPLFDNHKHNVNIEEVAHSAKLRPGYTFQNFAVSASNQMAYAAAEAVSKMPGSAYNPLFIWGGVGVGKTHLMNAVGYSILEKNTDNKVLCCTGEEFTNDIVEGIRNKTTINVRNKYRKLMALLIDDVQFIAGKDAVQVEFFHTFNALVGNGSQVVLTSDKPPSEISKLEERLRSRFEAGLIVDISPPDFELRCAIVQIKSKEKNLDIPDEIVHLIAGNIDAARRIEGFLVRLASQVLLNKAEINENLVRSLMSRGEEMNELKLKANPTEVISAVSKYFSIGKKSLLGNSRVKTYALPRQILMYILRTDLTLPLEEVGRLIGRDHTTVMHAVEKITNLASNNVEIREDIRGIKNII